MFSGITTAKGVVEHFSKKGECTRISVLPLGDLNCSVGDSVSVSGACLTIVAKEGDHLSFDISPETLNCTYFSDLEVNSALNLEKSLNLGDPVCGHLVTGHVDSVVELLSMKKIGENTVWEISLPEPYRKFVAPKGSIAIDGVSLTVNQVNKTGFFVNIIPYTLKNTSFDTAPVGCKMNMEVDLIARYVERVIDE